MAQGLKLRADKMASISENDYQEDDLRSQSDSLNDQISSRLSTDPPRGNVMISDRVAITHLLIFISAFHFNITLVLANEP